MVGPIEDHAPNGVGATRLRQNDGANVPVILRSGDAKDGGKGRATRKSGERQ
jgi:hypothetical protein